MCAQFERVDQERDAFASQGREPRGNSRPWGRWHVSGGCGQRSLVPADLLEDCLVAAEILDGWQHLRFALGIRRLWAHQTVADAQLRRLLSGPGDDPCAPVVTKTPSMPRASVRGLGRPPRYWAPVRKLQPIHRESLTYGGSAQRTTSIGVPGLRLVPNNSTNARFTNGGTPYWYP